ncbi:hypothetical protein [Ulvibacterium sp.]|uniref:hypothetical protein n=1 Tax=Ulvibacterium sp. TaxID=2665914 RepID=UPI003BAC6FD7
MEHLNETLGGLVIVIGAVLIVLIVARYTYLVKKAMIEKGLTFERKDYGPKYLDMGCIVSGIGLGLLASSIFTYMDLEEDTMDLLIWGTILIFGAMGLIAAHFIGKRLGQ